MLKRFVLPLVFLLGLANLCQATPSITLSKASSGMPLNTQAELLEDTQGTLTIADIDSAEQQARFQPANGRASVGQSLHPWWIKLQLQREKDAPSRWVLEVGSVTLLDLQLYLPDGQGGWQLRQAGEHIAFRDNRDHPYRRMVFDLPSLDEQPLTLYLRTFDPAGNSFPLSIWQLDDLTQLATHENLGLGTIYGIIFALLLYNLFILIALRNQAYFWYVLTTAFALLFIISMTGHGAQYFWPNHPVPVWLDRITLPSLWGLLVCRFTQTLLQTRLHVRWAHRLLNTACVIYLIAITLNLFEQRYLAAWMITLLPLISIPAALGSAIVRWRQGFLPAQLYLYGYGLVLSSVIILLLRATGVLQPAQWNAYAFPLAVAAESVLFSFALAYRIQMLKLERAEALQQADREKTARLAQLQTSTDELQAAVDARTAELAATNEQLRTRERELQHAAFHDPLTELPNRRYLIERCESALAHAERHEESAALLLIDLDHFKPINDRYGHAAGDVMLQAVGKRLREQVRAGDTVARLGGDEFAALIGGKDAERQARDIAQRLLAALSEPVLFGSERLSVTISIGAALYPRHARNFTELYHTADLALYQVKEQGRSGSRVHDDNDVPGVLTH
ncbi:putative diguanylate cyclase AdrA [Pseudomonas sp. 8Z]|uniref:diguanylate cyclase n=1 Tax=Pseudomonas sp. 8Z TaxID=2653166 RepID=UPI0012F18371|nr:diguanylate cyclase [Pseudomonas sp. 8Z]VXC17163.1 putative diguanylate cyclase AdrA [Pseudomonas sp. 8Z]